MSTSHRLFHRIGSLGGPGCPVGELPIGVHRPDGSTSDKLSTNRTEITSATASTPNKSAVR